MLEWIQNRLRRIYTLGFKDDFKHLVKIAVPILLSNFGVFLVPIFTIIFCGQIGKYELDASSLANTIVNMSGITMVVGLSSACDTLFPQIYGSQNKKMLGAMLQKGLVIEAIGSLPAMVLLLNGRNLAVMLNQEPQIVKYLKTHPLPLDNSFYKNRLSKSLLDQYMIFYMPSIFFLSLNAVLTKYIQCQNIVYPVLFISLGSTVLSVIFNAIFIFGFHLGIRGAALSVTLANLFALLATIAYILISKIYRETWSGWSYSCLEDWWPYMKLSIPGLFMILFEIMAYEIGTFLTSLLGPVKLAAQGTVMQVLVSAYMIPFSISMAGSIYLGQLLGSNKSAHAKNVFKVTLTTCFMAIGVVVVLILSFSRVLPRLFTSDKEISDLASRILLLVGVVHIFDGGQGTMGCILRCIGAQLQASMFNLVGFYVVGMPIGLSLLLRSSLHVYGFWLGVLIGAGSLFTIQVIFVCRINWEKEAAKAVERTKDEHVDDKSETSSQLGTMFDLSDPIFRPDEPVKNKTCLILKRLACFAAVLLVSAVGIYTRSLGKVEANTTTAANSTTVSYATKQYSLYE